MSERGRRAPGEGLGPASRAFLLMSEGEAALESEEASRARKLAALGLAVLALFALPLLWFTLGPGNDQAVAVVAGKSHDDNSGPGSGDDDNSGPGGGDDSTDDDTASATSRNNRDTRGTTRGEATTTNDTATSKRGDSTRGTTRGDPTTRDTSKGTSTGTSRGTGTRGTTRGGKTN
jgi:hypothetical protein